MYCLDIRLSVLFSPMSILQIYLPFSFLSVHGTSAVRFVHSFCFPLITHSFTMKAANEFRSDFYHKWLLMPILIGQFGVILINLFYCAIAIGLAIHRAWHGMSWDWEAFYPLRTSVSQLVLIPAVC